MRKRDGFIFLLFFPACIGILNQIFQVSSLSAQLLAIGLFLLAIDQAKMAVIDLDQVDQVRSHSEDRKKNLQEDPRISGFYKLIIFTICLELIGFYLAGWFLGWGIQIVLWSQLIFNSFASIQLQPTEPTMILPRSKQLRSQMVITNGLSILLMGLWMQNIAPLSIVLGLWSLAIIYIIGKYILGLSANNRDKSTV